MLNFSTKQVGLCLTLATFAILSLSLVGEAEESETRQTPTPAALTRTEVDGLLAQARSKIAAGKLSEAEVIVQRAEAAELRYPVLHFGDTPAKVRRALEKLSGNPGRLGTNSALRNPLAALAPKRKLVTTDPFAPATAGNAAARPVARVGSVATASTPPPLALPQMAPPLPRAISQPKSIAGTQVRTAQFLDEERYAATAGNLPQIEGLPANSQIAPHENHPAQHAADFQQASSVPQQIAMAAGAVPVDLRLPVANTGQQLPLRVAQAAKPEPSLLPAPAELLPETSDPYELLEQGEQALRERDRNRALRLFRLAHEQREQLDHESQEQLQGHLQMLSGNRGGAKPRPSRGQSLLNSATAGHAVVARQLSAEIGRRQSEASRMRTSNPQGALETLQNARELVAKSELDEGMKHQLTRRVELSIAEVEQYIRDHQAELELDDANRTVLEDIDRERAVKGQVRERMAELVNQFNTLRDEQRYAEMEVVAKRLYDMAPDEPVAQQVWENAKFIRRSMLNREIDEMTDEGVVGIFQGIRKDAAQGLLDSDKPIRYGDTWSELVKGRAGSSDRSSRMSARELEIERKLRTPVLPRYNEMPLSQVIEGLSNLTGVNIHLDARGLGQEGVRSDSPVTLNLGQEISLESTLNLILEPLHLTYMIKDEVLKITSEQLRDGEVYAIPYNVADLVVPIPNFVPSTNMGLQGLINDAYDTVARTRQGGVGMSGPISLVAGNQAGPSGPPMGSNTLAQQMGGGATNTGSGGPPISAGPGGLGGAASADFDSLIDLIVSTVEFDTWMENGTGEGEIRPFPTNLSLVVSQTQSVHEKVADLLEQLRRLQDLQVTIEVRFIRLTDSFFERIGIDFDFNIEDGSGIADLQNGGNFESGRTSATVGISGNPPGLGNPLPNFTVDLDVPFRQNSFALSSPTLGTPQDVGQFGFAILSDIEAFFLINASQGDSRSNELQAPKVTLFNGQQAIIVDASFSPFVISVIPVVGEFAAAQQPVIVVLSEGTTMTVQAVVSDDRRYVRLTMVPFFSQIGEVKTFTFEGSETTSSSSDTTDQDNDGNDETNNSTNNVVRSGTTVQLPTFQIISIATTVSVPDGGTVLLGGIKRLNEGRNEFGVPLLSKLPYVDRLFRNVGIGRTTDSLMMMVTPHIIIQEEEEERLGNLQN